MQLIYTANDINEANIVCGMLQANGIEAHVAGYYLQGGVGDLAALDFAKVYVDEEDTEQAAFLIADYENQRKPSESTNPETTSNARFFWGGLLIVLVFVAIFIASLFAAKPGNG